MNYFAYITKDILTNGLYCHVFCVKSEVTSPTVLVQLQYDHIKVLVATNT